MRTIQEHIADLQKPISQAQATQFHIEQVEWERDVYLDFLVRTLVASAEQAIMRSGSGRNF